MWADTTHYCVLFTVWLQVGRDALNVHHIQPGLKGGLIRMLFF